MSGDFVAHLLWPGFHALTLERTLIGLLVSDRSHLYALIHNLLEDRGREAGSPTATVQSHLMDHKEQHPPAQTFWSFFSGNRLHAPQLWWGLSGRFQWPVSLGLQKWVEGHSGLSYQHPVESGNKRIPTPWSKQEHQRGKFNLSQLDIDLNS